MVKGWWLVLRDWLNEGGVSDGQTRNGSCAHKKKKINANSTRGKIVGHHIGRLLCQSRISRSSQSTSVLLQSQARQSLCTYSLSDEEKDARILDNEPKRDMHRNLRSEMPNRILLPPSLMDK